MPDTAKVPIPEPNRKHFMQVLCSFPDARITACSSGLLSPCSGLLYGLADLRTCSPLNIARYYKFMNKLGARLAYCSMIEIPPSLNRLIDIASVELIASACPLRSTTDNSTRRSPSGLDSCSGRIMPGMRLVKTECNYVPGSAEIDANISMRIHDCFASRYQVYVVLKDEHNHGLWRSDCRVLSVAKTDSQAHNINLSWIIPTPVHGAKQVKLILVVRDTWTGDLIKPDGNSLTLANDMPAIVLGSYVLTVPKDVMSPDGRFQLLFETEDLLRIYRNKQALPRAFLVHKIIQADSEDRALENISSIRFKPELEVVLEKDGRELPHMQATGAQTLDNVQILKSSNTELKIACETNTPAILVLTDVYYPGWQAEVDGKLEPILRANYLFRSVPIQAGLHTVSFRYVPLSLTAGLTIAVIAAIIGLAAMLFTRNRF